MKSSETTSITSHEFAPMANIETISTEQINFNVAYLKLIECQWRRPTAAWLQCLSLLTRQPDKSFCSFSGDENQYFRHYFLS